MSGSWTGELWLLAVGLLVGWLIGSLAGLPWVAAFIVTGLYLAWHVYNVHRLQRWLSRNGRNEPPAGWGVWAVIYDRIYRMQRRNRKRKRKLGRILSEFSASTAALPDAAVVLDPIGCIQWFNDAAEKYLGLRSPQDYGQRVGNLVRHPVFTRYMLRADYTKPAEIPAPEDQSITLSVRVIPYGSDQRLLIARDVSEAKRLETMRRDFIANASHELRTPLTVLQGYLEMMEDDLSMGRGTSDWEQPVQEMSGQARRMASIIGDLLRLAELESANIFLPHARVDVSAIIREQVDEHRGLLGSDHAFELALDSGLSLYGRRDDYTSAFSNLLTNALRYTPPGGEIHIRWWADAQGAHLSVADSGIGIPTRDIPRLTERFYRVDVDRSRSRGGTGLGLAIVKHVLERYGGSLGIASEMGKGSEFVCHFPLDLIVSTEAKA